MSVGWTSNRIDQLKILWERGLSASQIAAELGHVTRNGVIGKVHRLNLDRRRDGRRSSGRPRVIRAPRATPVAPPRPPAPRLAPAKPEPVLPKLPVAFDIPAAQRLSLLQLTDATCHWPVGDPGAPGFYFCGGKALQGLPYCAHHARVAYQPASARNGGRTSHGRC
jgi:GcrA cell cycle regulator